MQSSRKGNPCDVLCKGLCVLLSPSVLKSLWLQARGLKCSLSLLIGVNLLTGFGQRSDHYICVKKGGTCNFSSCPLFQRIEGTCYGRKAKCCIR